MKLADHDYGNSWKRQNVLPWHSTLLFAILCAYGPSVRTIALMTDRGPVSPNWWVKWMTLLVNCSTVGADAPLAIAALAESSSSLTKVARVCQGKLSRTVASCASPITRSTLGKARSSSEAFVLMSGTNLSPSSDLIMWRS